MSSEWIEPIAKLYVDRVIRESDIQDHMPRLKVMVEQLMPINIIELGTRQGYSTVAFLTALRTRPHAHLYSVDMQPVYGELEPWRDNIDQWTFLETSDIPYPAGLPQFADMIFLDTDHLLETTRAEIITYMDHLSEDGVMLFHDIAIFRNFGVRQAIQEFLARNPAWKAFYWEDCNGLAVLYHRKDEIKIEGIIGKING
jgi:predicted O-methyltransferase YrrM